MNSNNPRNQFSLTFKVFLAHYRSHPLQAGAILLGITLAVALFCGIKITNKNAISSYQQTSELLSAPATANILPADGYKYLDEKQYFLLRQQGIAALAVVTGTVYDQNNHSFKIQGSDLIAAIEQNKYTHNQNNQSSLFDNKLPINRLLRGDLIVVMSEKNQQKYAPDNFIYLNNKKFEVISSSNKQLANYLLMDISAAQSLLGKNGKLS